MKKLMILPALAVAFMTFSAMMPASAHCHSYWRHERWVAAHQVVNPYAYGPYGGYGAYSPAYYGAYNPYYGGGIGGSLHRFVRAF
jgi:hypothetical protein